MDRAHWLAEQRRAAEADYDEGATTYDEEDIEITPTHRRFLGELLDRCPPDSRILDVPCGTGKYFGLVLDRGCTLVGVDQSAGMLAAARAKYPRALTEKLALQELTFDNEFDGVICIDSMENVCPEEWPSVVGRLRRALRLNGILYLTVETKQERQLVAAFAQAKDRGLPVVRGESVMGGYYHYYPPLSRVQTWLSEAGLHMIEDGYSRGDGYGYYHVLVEAGMR
jgi:ubiquinone/menaquinone biosynthesis C-methylase UbiE